MKQFRWYIFLSLILIVFSLLVYLIQIYIFNRPEDTLFYMLQDLSFVPIQVLLVTLIIDRLLQRKEKQTLIKKLNMVIGVFFNELGTELLKIYPEFNDNFSQLSTELRISTTWTNKHFSERIKYLKGINYSLKVDNRNLTSLKSFLLEKRMILLQILDNPNLMERDTFTELLLAVSHLTEELSHRTTFEGLPQQDYDHLRGDINRTYSRLIVEWLTYMNHLKRDYPYLFSIAVRTNPFDPGANILVTE
jgi:hypothetical protein